MQFTCQHQRTVFRSQGCGINAVYLSTSADGFPEEPARVMFAQSRPALADRNGRGVPASPTKEELRKIIADRDRVIAEKENMIAQDRAQKEEAKKASTEAYSQGQPTYTQAQTDAYQKRCQKRAALEALGQGARHR